MDPSDIPFIAPPKDSDNDNEEEDDQVTTVKSVVKGRFIKMLQDKDDLIKYLIHNITETNKELLEANKALSLNNSFQRNIPSQKDKDNSRCKQLDDMLTEIKTLRDLGASLLTKGIQEGIHNYSGLTPPPQQQQQFEQQNQMLKWFNERQANEEKMHNMIVDNANRMSKNYNPDPTVYSSKEEFAKSHEGFPPSSVEQALKSHPRYTAADDVSKEFMRSMLSGICSNPELFNKMINGDPIFPPKYTPQQQQPKTDSNSKDESALTIQNDNPLGKLVNRIEQHNNEMKEQEIQDFLNSDINL